MITDELNILESSKEWGKMIEQTKQLIEGLWKEMRKRRKDVIRNQKYKLTN